MNLNLLNLPLQVNPKVWGYILDANGFNVAEVYQAIDSNARTEEIVRRVNAHDDLLAAGKKAMTAMSHAANITDQTRLGWAMVELEAAIAKAEKRAA